MPLPLTVSCFSKIQIDLIFLVPAHPGSPGKRAVKRVCVCVCVCGRACEPSGERQNIRSLLRCLSAISRSAPPYFATPANLSAPAHSIFGPISAPLSDAVKAKFHYTDPTRTGPDTDKVGAHCRRRAKFHYTDPTRTRPDPHGPARTFLRRNSVGSVRVRSGPCSGI